MEWLKKLLIGKSIETEMEKLRADIADLVARGIKKGVEANVLRGQAYIFMDGILAEGQRVSKDKLDSWWTEKRAQLRVWAGE